jgi:hypothetical protein
MAKLTYAQRQKLPARDFALPGRRYPIDTPARARNALARKHFASPSEQATICRRVHAKYPQIHATSCPTHSEARGVSRMEKT